LFSFPQWKEQKKKGRLLGAAFSVLVISAVSYARLCAACGLGACDAAFFATLGVRGLRRNLAAIFWIASAGGAWITGVVPEGLRQQSCFRGGALRFQHIATRRRAIASSRLSFHCAARSAIYSG